METTKASLLIAAVGCLCLASGAADRRVASPDGSLAVIISDADGLRYRVEVDGRPLLKPSRLGLEFDGGVKLGAAAAIEKAQWETHDGTWENRFGKRRVVSDRWNQLRLTLAEPGTPGRRFGLLVRAYDDGVALRYDLPRASRLDAFVLRRELTEFAFADDYRCWAGEPSSCAESLYPERTLGTIPQHTGSRGETYKSVLPLLVQASNCYVAVAESDLLDWAGMFVTGTGSATIGVTLAPRGDGLGCVVSRTPRVSPWRVLMIARAPGGLIGSDLIANLATPCRLADTSWIKPGCSAWDPWWTGVNPRLPENKGLWARGDTRTDREYIDFAAEMGWPYQLVDWFWYENMTSRELGLNRVEKKPAPPRVDFSKHVPYLDLPALLAHAKQNGVRLMIWLDSYDLDQFGIERACALFSRWGAAGLKIDFMNSDSQETIAWYAKVIATAARYRLLIDFHGAGKPTGLSRTWPNYITQEGVLGNEYNKIGGNRCTPLHTITLPFTRGLLGPMDFTPGGFINVPVAEFRTTQPAEVMGTRARQLAMPVIYQSPLTVFCDSPANYRGAAGIQFYRGLPTVWDDTVVPSAEPAQHIVIARRSGDRWWLAAMNGNNALKLRIPLDFLAPGPWTLRSFADAPDAATNPKMVVEKLQSVASGETIELELAPAGGYAAVFTRTE
jgi:alpha-glucosidase